MVEKWAGKVAVVTGSGSGIGLSVFKEFVKNKIKVIGLDINPEKTLQVIESLSAIEKTTARAIYCNVADPDSV